VPVPPPHGMLLVDKPAGPTSHDVVAAVRRALGTRRVGHAGTLDPFATGLLVVLVGGATRLAQFLVGLPKEYEGTIRLGVATTTDDGTGEALEISDAWRSLSDETIREAMASLTGHRQQRPPRFSAKKVAGRTAHRRARRGEPFELAPEWVDVERFTLDSREGPDLTFHAGVASGVYVRALARDLGERLGCGAHVTALRRTAVGCFCVTDAVPWDRITAGGGALRPPSDAVRHLTPVQVDDASRAEVRHGRTISAPQDARGMVALLAGDDLVAVARADGGVLRPSVVLDG
jgi:tRNA pseudouridine55 synthase